MTYGEKNSDYHTLASYSVEKVLTNSEADDGLSCGISMTARLVLSQGRIFTAPSRMCREAFGIVAT
jgi:hypothetical protein